MVFRTSNASTTTYVYDDSQVCLQRRSSSSSPLDSKSICPWDTGTSSQTLHSNISKTRPTISPLLPTINERLCSDPLPYPTILTVTHNPISRVNIIIFNSWYVVKTVLDLERNGENSTERFHLPHSRFSYC